MLQRAKVRAVRSSWLACEGKQTRVRASCLPSVRAAQRSPARSSSGPSDDTNLSPVLHYLPPQTWAPAPPPDSYTPRQSSLGWTGASGCCCRSTRPSSRASRRPSSPHGVFARRWSSPSLPDCSRSSGSLCPGLFKTRWQLGGWRRSPSTVVLLQSQLSDSMSLPLQWNWCESRGRCVLGRSTSYATMCMPRV